MSMEILKQLFVYFIIYSFLGWVLEVLYHLVINKKFINRGFLLGPLCPIYGFGAVILIVLLHNVGDSYLKVFLWGAFFASLLEFITGYVLEKLFKQKWWDYSQMKFNIGGYIALEFSIVWGFVAIFLIEYLHPFILTLIHKVPTNVMNILIPVVFVILMIDVIYTVDSLIQFRKVLDGIREVKEKYEDSLKSSMEDMKQREENIKIKLRDNLSDKLGKESLRYKLTHRKFLRSYPDLMNPEWVKRLKDSIGKK